MRVPESSQRRGSEAVTANQIARVMQQAVVKKYLGDHFVFDGELAASQASHGLEADTLHRRLFGLVCQVSDAGRINKLRSDRSTRA